MSKTTLLAIETSCDETGVAVLQKEGENIIVLAQALASQTDIHALTGGVVPDVAAREHARVITPLIKKVVHESSPYLTPNPSPKLGERIDAIAVTVGPGLIPALAVGVQTARTLAYAWHKPIIPVHHIEGHIASALLSAQEIPNPPHFAKASRGKKSQIPNKFKIPNAQNTFPALALVVSGGHTMLILMRDYLQYEVIGQTRDDAAGEAFDKVARLLELPYPGGPHLSRLAATGNNEAFDFPRPMINSGDFDFSFSGLKTAVLYTLRDSHTPASPIALAKGDRLNSPPAFAKASAGRQAGGENAANIAASFEQAVVDVLMAKTKKAVQKFRPKMLLLAGGVAANKPLRHQLKAMAEEINVPLQIAPPNLCGDNAVMIGQVGLLAFEKGRQEKWQNVDAAARIPIESFTIT